MQCPESVSSFTNFAGSPIESAEPLARQSADQRCIEDSFPRIDQPGRSNSTSGDVKSPVFSSTARALLSAAGTNDKLDGSALAMRVLSSSIAAAALIWPDQGHKSWIEICQEIQQILRSPNLSGAESLKFASAPKLPSDLFELVVACTVPSIQSGPAFESFALLGRVIIQSAAKNQILPIAIVKGFTTLGLARKGKGRRSPEWSSLLDASFVDSRDLRKVRLTLRPDSPPLAFVDTAIAILETLTLPPPAPVSITPAAGNSQEAFGLHEAANHTPVVDDQADVTSKSDEVQRQESVPDISARLASADYSGFAEKLGIPHRDHLLVSDLADITTELRGHLMAGTPIAQGHALLATMSLVTGCTDDAALELGFSPGHSIWLDLAKGAWAWDFNVYKLSTSDPRDANVQAVFCAWPAILDAVLALAWQKNPDARTLKDLVLAIQCRSSFDLPEFRKFLRGCGHSSHPPLRGRFARSLAYAYLEVTGSDMTSAILCGFFTATAPAALFYFGPNYQTLVARTSQVYERLGLGPPSHLFNERGRAGCLFVLPPSVLQSGWGLLTDAINRARLAAFAATAPAVRVDHCNRWLALVAAAFIIQTAHRSTRLECLTAGALFTHPDALIVLDKDEVDRAQPRLIPKTQVVDKLLKSALECHRVVESLAQPGTPRVVREWRFSDHVFVQWKFLRTLLEKEVMSTSLIASITGKYFQSRSNFGRSQWVTYLDEFGCNRWLIRALTGHTRDVTRVSGAYLDVPPLTVAIRLRMEMEKVGHHLFGETDITAAEAAAPTFRLSMTRPRATHQMVIGPVPDPRTILEPLTIDTLAEWKLATRIRADLLAGRVNASAEVLAVLHLIYIDLMPNLAVCIDAVKGTNDVLEEIGNQAGLYWKRDYFIHRTWLPIQSTTARLLNQTGDKTISATALIAKTCSAIRERGYGTWPLNDGKCWEALGLTADGFRRLSFPPSMSMVSDPGVAAPCLSITSLRRLAGEPANEILQIPIQRPARQIAGRKAEDSRFLVATLGKYASTVDRHGEKGARAIKCLKVLDEYDAPWSPFIHWIKTFVVDELQRSRARLDDSLQISSILTYCSTLLCSQDKIDKEVDPAEWTDSEWWSWAMQVNQESKTDAKPSSGNESDGHFHDRAKFALAAMVRSLQRRQEYVPFSVTSKLGFASKVMPHGSASSCLILSEDHPRSLIILREWYAEHPADFALVEGRSMISTMVPMRTGDSSSLSTNCLTPNGGLVIERAGYNVHKTQNAIRVVPLGEMQAGLFRAKLIELDTYFGARPLLFRGDGSPAAGLRDQRLAADWSTALKCATGDHSARPHSVRAATLQEIAWPGWERLAAALLNGAASASVCRAWTDVQASDWTRLARAAAMSGQGDLRSAAGNYLAGWHLLHGIHASASLADLNPGAVFLQQLGIKDDAFRQARSRALRQSTPSISGNSFDAWRWVTAQIMGSKTLSAAVPAKKAAQQDSVKATPLKQDDVAPAGAERVRQELSYLTLRTLGLTSQMALEKTGVPLSSTTALESVLPAESSIAQAVARARQGPEQRAQAAHVRMAESENGWLCMSWLLYMNFRDYKLMQQLFFRDSLESANPSVVLRQVASSIPTAFSLQAQLGAAHVSPADLSALAALSPALTIVTNPRIGARPVVSVHLRHTKNLVVSARLTALARIHFLVIDAHRQLSAKGYANAR